MFKPTEFVVTCYAAIENYNDISLVSVLGWFPEADLRQGLSGSFLGSRSQQERDGGGELSSGGKEASRLRVAEDFCCEHRAPGW